MLATEQKTLTSHCVSYQSLNRTCDRWGLACLSIGKTSKLSLTIECNNEISDALGLMRGKRQLVFLKYAVNNKIGTRQAIRGDFYKSLKNTSLYGLRSSQYLVLNFGTLSPCSFALPIQSQFFDPN